MSRVIKRILIGLLAVIAVAIALWVFIVELSGHPS